MIEEHVEEPVTDYDIRALWDRRVAGVIMGTVEKDTVRAGLLRNLHGIMLSHGLPEEPTLAEFEEAFRERYRRQAMFRFFVKLLRVVW